MKCGMKTSLLALCAFLPVSLATRASLVADTCQYNTYMCCWTENDNGVEDNADVCLVNGEFQEGDETVHCHGMVWADGASFESFILPLYKFVRTFDHRDARGYYGRIDNAPQCECIEKMPVVTRADCTTYSSQGLVACRKNDLRTHYDGVMESPGGELPNLVKNCEKARGMDTSNTDPGDENDDAEGNPEEKKGTPEEGGEPAGNGEDEDFSYSGEDEESMGMGEDGYSENDPGEISGNNEEDKDEAYDSYDDQKDGGGQGEEAGGDPMEGEIDDMTDYPTPSPASSEDVNNEERETPAPFNMPPTPSPTDEGSRAETQGMGGGGDNEMYGSDSDSGEGDEVSTDSSDDSKDERYAYPHHPGNY